MRLVAKAREGSAGVSPRTDEQTNERGKHMNNYQPITNPKNSDFVRMDCVKVGDIIQQAHNIYEVVSVTPKQQRKGANARLIISTLHLESGVTYTHDYLVTAICIRLAK